MALDPCPVRIAEEAHGTQCHRRQQLHRQNRIHLAHKLVADVDRRLRHRPAKL